VIFSPSVGSGGAARCREQQRLPAPGGFAPLGGEPSCPRALLTRADIHRCNTWESTSVSSGNVFIRSGFIACVFPRNHPPFHDPVGAYHLLAQPEKYFVFPSQRININSGLSFSKCSFYSSF